MTLSVETVRQTYAAGRLWVESALSAFFSFAAFKLATSET